ncbi:MAG: NADH-quinone oxidoreductase subunit C [Clostridiales bacterium]|nr:NADH-quinone oxidoreductase subunit C [Clostridiales bacterium]
MLEKQITEEIEIDKLFSRCAELKFCGYRLVQIGCTRTVSGVEINYSFDNNFQFLNLRISCEKDQTVPSIQSVYECAFIYENEIAELFGITITDMKINFNGLLYKAAVSTPFGETAAETKAVR